SSDSGLRATVARTLQQLGGSRALFDLLGRAVAEAGFAGRIEAMDVLVGFAKQQAIPALQAALISGSAAEKVHALKHLGNAAVLGALQAIGTDAVLPPLVDALAHNQIPVRNRAAEVLKQLSMEGKLDVSRTVIWLLRSRDVNVRRMATEIIRTVADPDQQLWPKLMGVLRDEDWWVRERVMDALIELGGVRLTAHVVSLLTDASDVIRRFAVSVLGRIKDPKALRSLVQMATEDTDWWVKETAVESVAAIN